MTLSLTLASAESLASRGTFHPLARSLPPVSLCPGLHPPGQMIFLKLIVSFPCLEPLVALPI